MSLRVVGAGLGRTGTNSLKLALEELLGGPCYHMFELIERPGDIAAWEAAVRGEAVDWDSLLGAFAATVDWPACAFWRQILAANPGATVLLSTRESADQWWASMEQTIVPTLRQAVAPDDEARSRRRAMTLAMLESTFDPRWGERDAAMAAYERHNEAVRREVPAGQLIEWTPGDGWEPLSNALGAPVPAKPFPHTNAAADFRDAQELE